MMNQQPQQQQQYQQQQYPPQQQYQQQQQQYPPQQQPQQQYPPQQQPQQQQQQQQQQPQETPDYTAIGGNDKIAGFINSIEWFKYIVGYTEEDYKAVIKAKGTDQTIRKDPEGNFIINNGSQDFCAGKFNLRSVDEMNSSFSTSTLPSVKDKLELLIYYPENVRDMSEFFLKLGVSGLQVFADIDESNPKHPKSMFQVASNFNGIETIDETATPDSEDFTTNYIYDHTQGPGASVSAGPAAIARVFAAFYDESKPAGEWAQRGLDHQINMLSDVSGYYNVINGYVVNSVNGSDQTQPLMDTSEEYVNSIAGKVKLCVHENADVTFGARYYDDDENDYMAVLKEPHRINQVFTAAMNLRQGPNGKANQMLQDSPAKSRVLLRASYVGSYLAAVNTGCESLYLTLIGGGAFGNDLNIIFDEIIYAHKKIGLDERNGVLKKVYLWTFKKTRELEMFVGKLKDAGIKYTCAGITI